MAFVDTLTDVGIGAIIRARADAVYIKFGSATFSSDLLSHDTDDLKVMTSLSNVTYTATLDKLQFHIIDNDEFQIRITLPPSAGPFAFGSYSLNLEDGTPFIIGTWDNLQYKTTNVVRYINKRIRISNVVPDVDFTILNAIDAALPEVPTETDLPSAASAPYPVYYVHALSSYENLPAIAMRLSTTWYFLPDIVRFNATGTSLDHTKLLGGTGARLQLEEGKVKIGPINNNNANDHQISFVDTFTITQASIIRKAVSGDLHITGNNDSSNPLIYTKEGELTAKKSIATRYDSPNNTSAFYFSNSSGNIVGWVALDFATGGIIITPDGGVHSVFITAAGDLVAGHNITGTNDATAGHDVIAGNNVSSVNDVNSGRDVTAARNMSAIAINNTGTIHSDGFIATSSSVLANLNIEAGAILKAAVGAYASGDPHSGVILSDFVTGSSVAGWWMRFPNGVLLQAVGIAIDGGVINQVGNFPVTFPNGVAGVFGNFGSNLTATATLGTEMANTSQFYATNTGPLTASPYGAVIFAIGD